MPEKRIVDAVFPDADLMPDYQHFTIQEREGVHVVYLTSVDATPDVVKQVGMDLMDFAQAANPQRLLVNFRSVERLSAPVIGKLLVFIRAIRASGGVVECCEGADGFGELLGVIGRSLPFDHLNDSEAKVVDILKSR